MDRLVWVTVACGVLVGCQAPKPNFDPFAITGQTRIPSPATGAVGRPGSYYPPAIAPLPPLNTGTSTRYGEHLLSPSRHVLASTVQPSPRIDLDSAASSELERADPLTWRGTSLVDTPPHRLLQEDPSVVSYPAYSLDQQFVADTPHLDRPRPLPNPGPHQSLVSRTGTDPPPVSPAPRIRGFVNSGVREVRIPATLADVDSGGVRQVDTASNQWQARYDSTR